MSDGSDQSGFFGGGGMMSGLQTMGIVQAMKTGDVKLDMMIAMLIPVLMSVLFGMIGRFSKYMDIEILLDLYRKYHQHPYQRYIVYRAQRHSWGSTTSLDADTKNSVLIKAIQLYLHTQCPQLQLPIANINLTSMEDKASGESYETNDDDDEDAEAERSSSKTFVGTLSKYKLVKKPPLDQWHKLGMYGEGDKSNSAMVSLWITESEEAVGKAETDNSPGRSHYTITYHFVSTGPTAIDAFIETAYRWYIKELRKLEDNNARYLYELQNIPKKNSTSGGGGGDDVGDDAGAPTVEYCRYKLSNEKTFTSLFFRQKESLMASIDHFQSKTGKYAIAGYPHKLGLLLHGPPGTGKTSLIKALAQYTNRSIVNVPLTRISTNSELMDIFFAKKYHVRGEDVPIKLGFKDVIFVLEDVDAASKVVRRRTTANASNKPPGGKVGSSTATATTAMSSLHHRHYFHKKSTWEMLLESKNAEARELVTMLMEKSDRLRDAANASDVLPSIAYRMQHAVPGLSMIGSSAAALGGGDNGDNAAHLAQMESQTVEKVNAMMEKIDAVDRYVGAHAESIKALLEGAHMAVSDAFVDELLGVATASHPLVRIEETPSLNGTTTAATGPPAGNNTIRSGSYSRYDDMLEEEMLGPESDAAMLAAAMDMGDFAAGGGGDDDDDEFGNINNGDDNNGDSSRKRKRAEGPSWWSKPIKDQLNLTGLLNGLDGVVDTPGRILIMTTNHPEMLDPALIRPGRIDKKMLLGYMSAIDVIHMMEHYFQTVLDTNEKHQLEELITDRGFNLTPAQVEQMTAEHETVHEMIQALRDRSNLRTQRRRGSSHRRLLVDN